MWGIIYMQTVYLLKDCTSSYKALKMLYASPDLSTNIIIVDAEQAQILLLDKRVRTFPFIINSLPTQIGLIPKSSQVMPLSVFMMLKDFHENGSPQEIEKNDEQRVHYAIREVHRPVRHTTEVRRPVRHTTEVRRPVRHRSRREFYKRRPSNQKLARHANVTTKRSSDGGVNILLK